MIDYQAVIDLTITILGKNITILGFCITILGKNITKIGKSITILGNFFVNLHPYLACFRCLIITFLGITLFYLNKL